MSRHRKKNGIPDRWLDYTAVGKRLHGTRFVAFKVPLKPSLNRQVQRSEAFGPWELLETLKTENEELGLIVDLTFTTRYYNLQDLPESLLFVKIFTAGHEVPSDATILSFKRAVRSFLRHNADNDKVIGVHCTHGVNRTGYLICRYLIDVDGMDPREAVELFNVSRGHAIERQNYLEDLERGAKRSNEGMEESEQDPQRGSAAQRPCPTFLQSDDTDESRYHRSFPPRSRDGLLPYPPLLYPPPFFRPPMVAPFHPYRWTVPHLSSQWSRPPSSSGSSSRYPTPEPQWSPASRLQEDRRRGLLPPPLPYYSPQWSSQVSGYDGAEEEWDGPKMRHYRPTHRANGYEQH